MQNKLREKNRLRALIVTGTGLLILLLADAIYFRFISTSYIAALPEGYDLQVFIQNLLPVLGLSFILWLASARIMASFVLTAVFVDAVFFANQLKLINLRQPLMAIDFILAPDMLGHSGLLSKYFLSYWHPGLLGILLVAGLLLLWFERPVFRLKPLWRMSAVAILLVVFISPTAVGTLRDFYRPGDDWKAWDPGENLENYGLLYSLMHDAGTMISDIGKFDPERIADILSQDTSRRFVPDDSLPPVENIVVILSESFFDPADLVGVRAGQYDLAAYTDLQNRSLTGKMTVPTYAGRTLRTEFELMTGIDLAVALVAVDGGPARRTLEMTGRPEDVRFAWNQGIATTERNQKMEQTAMRAVARVGDEYVYKKLMDLKKGVEKVQEQRRGSVRFAGLQDRYFTIVGVVPWEQGEPVDGTIRLSGDQDKNTQSWSIDVPARRGDGGEIARAAIDLYIGPQVADLLKAYDQGLEKSMDLGWKLFRPLAEVVLWGLKWMHQYIPNYGVIIIIFSVLTKLAFYPLTRTSTQSMKKMQELQPKLKALQEKYKNDKEKLNKATMELYQKEKINPLAGCLPLLVQSPVFIALYQALNHTISLRGQPFVLWIEDLSQPDALTQLPIALPFLGSDLNVLPILMAVAMYFQTKMTPTSGAGGQMAVMNTMMPLVMVFIFYNMPSGLVLYWLVNTILQGYQSWKIHKTAPSQGAQTA